MKFELDRLISHDDDEILAELKRVTAIAPEGTLSRRIFEQHSRVSAKTVRRRFGSWEAALQRAQLQGRYSGAVVTEKQMVSVAKQMTDTKLIDELRRVASELCRDIVTTRELDEHSRVGSAIFRRRFGSWKAAMESAGLAVGRSGQRFTTTSYSKTFLLSGRIMDVHQRRNARDTITRNSRHLQGAIQNVEPSACRIRGARKRSAVAKGSAYRGRIAQTGTWPAIPGSTS